MVPYFLDFHENIRFSKALSEYQEQPYPIEKTTIPYFDPPKKEKRVTFVDIHGIAKEYSYIQYSWVNTNGLDRKVTTFVKSSLFEI